ncbi:MAG: hypothetical protein AD742_03570 [Methylibium sp. NZG]|nr:MAG: hypothetical protein AD742_03570 [Methylibium sp. NZG]
MRLWQPTALALALAAAFPTLAVAQSSADLANELKALKDRIGQLEEKLKAADAAAKPADKQWGMTPEQAAEQNRIRVKTESIEDNFEAQGFKGLKISGQMDPTYIYNRNQSRGGFQFLNAVGDDGYNYDNSYFGMAMIDFQKEMEGGTRWRLTLAPNRGVGAVFDGQSMVHEASVSVPLTDLQTRLIAGQIPDWSGYEFLQPTLNKLITHNLLFDFTLPTAYTGAGLEVTRGKWIVKGVVANMNASKRAAGEKTPVFAYRVDYSRGEYQGFGFAGVHGKAANLRADDGVGNPVTLEPYSLRDTALHLFEVDGYFIRGDLTVQGQFSIGTQKNAAVTADPTSGELRNSRWWGVSALGAYKFMPRLEGIARADFLNNKKNGGGLLGYTFADGRNGIGPDTLGDPEIGANKFALSLGLQYLYNLNTTFKAEYRMDRASLPVFEAGGGSSFRKSNHLLGASMLVFF